MGYNAQNVLISALCFLVFLMLYVFDSILGVVFRLLDTLLEGPHVSKTVSRWSDCGCDSCLAWIKNANKLHVSVLEPTQANCFEDRSVENVVFLHGMSASSSVWTESVFPNLSESIKQSHRFFAIDLLGFGKSPKPTNCSYTLDENIEMIEQSVIRHFHLESFHLVAHSMGCMIAIALAAKHPRCVKSITLVAPPFFLAEDSDGEKVREALVKRRLWPPSLFMLSVMTWYEHIGRSLVIIFLHSHGTWEGLLKKLLRKSNLPCEISNFVQVTHRSIWQSMRNLICRGSKFMEMYLEVLSEARVKIYVIHGDQDEIVPVECSYNIKKVVPSARVDIIKHGDHSSIVHGRIKEFTTHIERMWASGS